METLKKLFTNFKKHSKIYIAFAMIITCVFGVMFVSNTFAYETDRFSYTVDNISFNSYSDNVEMIENNDNTITFRNLTSSRACSFYTQFDDFKTSNALGGGYYLLINYYIATAGSYGGSYVRRVLAASGTNTTSCQLTSNFTNNITGTVTGNSRVSYINYSDRYYITSKSCYCNCIMLNTTSIYDFQFNEIQFTLTTSVLSTGYWEFTIKNIDIVPESQLSLNQYYETYYGEIENNYNELLDDYDELQDNYDTLNDDYDELQDNYDTLNDNYTQLLDDYDELERNRLQLLSAFDGCNVQLFDNSNNLIISETLSLPSGANYINFDNLPNIKNYLSNYENNTYFYLIFNLNYSINNSLLFTFNNSVLEVDITISSTLNTFVETKTNMFNNANLYQLVINDNYNSFNKIKFDGIYTPDYWNNLNISITIDGASYQNGYRDGMHEGEIYQDLYDDLFTRYRELQNQYDELLNNSEFTYDDGYNDGFNDAINNEFSNSGLNTLFNAILSYPVNFIKEVFNFNFMGVNIAGVITFILSIGIVAFIINYFRKH